MRKLSLAALALFSCQPIMIGNPGEPSGSAGNDGGAALGADSSGSRSSNGGSTGGTAAGGVSTGGEAAGASSKAGTAADGVSSGGNSSAGNSATGSSAAPGGAGAGAGGDSADETPGVLNERLQLVIYDPLMESSGTAPKLLSEMLGVDAPDVLATRLVKELESVTAGHVHHDVLPTITSMGFPPTLDGFRYTSSSYQDCLANAADCHAEAADYDAMQVELALCDSVQADLPDQIWLLGADRFGFLGGKQLSCQVIEDGQFVTKTLDVVSLDYHDGFSSVLGSYQMFALGALQQVFGVPPANATTGAPDNTYGLFVQSRGRANDAPASGCGDITFAPNTLQPNRFDDPGTLPSYCDTFLHYPRTEAPLAAAVPVGCTAWGCSEAGFRGYWFAHLPQAPWSDEQGRLNDFWRYLLSPAERLPPPPVSVTCSSSYELGWCQHVTDKKRGVCNFNEWATLNETTGYVEFRFEPKQLVSGVQLYDRACDEQVLSGHLEFSDGSDPIGFEALETKGKVPTSMTFEPKLLSGLRVVIDDSTGPNPGFGEVTVASTEP
ncbi:MAG: hypothetical protein ABUL60_00795 [Myxococcales bacterium]